METHEWKPIHVVRSLYEVGKLAVAEVIMGRKPEPYPYTRIYGEAEAPVATEEELNE